MRSPWDVAGMIELYELRGRIANEGMGIDTESIGVFLALGRRRAAARGRGARGRSRGRAAAGVRVLGGPLLRA
eukprot:15462980-Alexandrium_andersonii.AAC.1